LSKDTVSVSSISSGISRKRAGAGTMFGLVEPGFLDYLVLADLAIFTSYTKKKGWFPFPSLA